MATIPGTMREPVFDRSSLSGEGIASGVSWPAVVAGASVASALSLVMLSLGAGLGLSTLSPWSHPGTYAGTLGGAAILWLILNEIISSAMGGYLAGRLRTKWASVHTDEVYFRDTAHGFLVWAVAVVITAAFLGTAATAMVGEAPASTATQPQAGKYSYYVDSLFRGAPSSSDVSDQAGRIFTRAIQEGQFSNPDRAYLEQLVSAKTSLTPADAQARVAAVLDQAKTETNETRKAAAHVLLWLFVALLIGAFSASYAATIGGRQRDHVKAI